MAETRSNQHYKKNVSSNTHRYPFILKPNACERQIGTDMCRCKNSAPRDLTTMPRERNATSPPRNRCNKFLWAVRDQLGHHPPGATKPWSNKSIEPATIGLKINNLLSAPNSPLTTSTCTVDFFLTRSRVCVQQLFSRKTHYERVRCERNCANLPFDQTCNQRYLCGASRSVSPRRKKTRIPRANKKSTATTKGRHAKCIVSMEGRHNTTSADPF